jgi:tetratricopeptide (TPR) repeat protein
MGTFWQTMIVALFVAAVLLARPAAADDPEACHKLSGDVAITACSRAITSGKYQGHALSTFYYNRGIKHGAKGDKDRAIQDYDQAIRLNPKDAAAFNNRGWVYFEKKDYDRAMKDYNEAIRLGPKLVNARDNRGLLYFTLGRLDQAIADFDIAVKLDPKDAAPLYGRGLIKLKKGDSTGSKDIEAAKMIQANIAEQFAKYGIKP